VGTASNFLSNILADRKITDEEVALLRDYLYRDEKLDLADVKLLVECYCQAQEYTPAFENLFLEVLERVMLADGEIDQAEQYYLLKMLYSDRVIRERERAFLLRLRSRLQRIAPDFEWLCQQALQAPSTNWDVGGR